MRSLERVALRFVSISPYVKKRFGRSLATVTRPDLTCRKASNFLQERGSRSRLFALLGCEQQ